MLIASTSISAQSGRTNKTIVADVLAQMPAERAADYNKQIGDLASTGEEGVLMLIDMMHAPGKGSNAQVEYALSGLTHYVAAQGQETARTAVVNGYLKALAKVEERETKAFVIRQLQLVGGDESVEALGRYLNGEELSGPAARALAAIGTEKAKQALQASLMRRMGTARTQADAILAIGEAQLPVGEELILGMVGNGDTEFQRVVLYALSRIGSVKALKPLADAADKTGYRYEKTQANEAYIQLIKRLAEQGQTKEAEKAAVDLLKKATKAGQTATRVAAQEILFDLRKANATKELLSALKDTNKEYRNAALDYASASADAPLYIEVIKAMAKAKPEVKIDVLNWIGREATCPQKNPILKKLDIRFDLPARQVIVNQLKDNAYDVKEAAVWALVKIGDPVNIPVLTGLLADKDEAVVLLAQQGLAGFPGDIDQAVVRSFAQSGDKGKIAALELLALRKADATINTVLDQTKSSSPAVQAAAYKALKDVVREKDFTLLAGMLELAGADEVKPLQAAVISSLATQTPDTRVNTLNRRMIQAGANKKHLYYTALATTGEAQALQALVDGFKAGRGVAKDEAFEALLQWQGPEVADELYTIATDKDASSYFDRALAAYIRLVSNPSITAENRVLQLRKAMGIAKTDDQKRTVLRQVQRAGTFQGLIFAGRYLDDKAVQEAAAQAVMNIALGDASFTGQTVRDLLNKVIAVLNNPDAGYQKEAIRKHLAEMPQGEGFVSLFNGKDLTGWKGLVENPIKRAKMTPKQLAAAQVKADEQMRNDWKVENGILLFDGTGYDNLCSEKAYGDIEMYIDWMLDPAGPEADAGIYLRGTPQVQMWDIARTNVGAQVGSGGLYNNQTHESKPLKVADNKLGEWNSMYIKMVGDRVTVYLNGELVTNDVILENYWNRKQPIFPVEQLELQAHGSKVYYRDIYVKELERTEPFQLSAEEQKEGYQILFDGTNMYEWTGNTVDYTLEDGTISLVPSKGSGGNLYTKKEYGNFVLRFDFQLTPAANNGLGIRTPMEGDAAYVGMELQILDSEHPVYKDLEVYQYHGSVYGVIPAKRGFLKPTGEWNTQEVIANGDHIRITLNGEVILDGNIREAAKNGTIDGKQHPGLFNKKGHIAFLGHGSPVKFRNIRIKEMK
ncbi:family 16 glycoside hydrolase [Parabacteroides sp. PF5-6]|uniref:family 16 glycoside hydrolase n=1 Tax=Parabacteroides sp. PF5-6 TaxID=1742403 RepID=UPI003217E359